MANSNLTKAKSAKNDEFYTQYADIQKEMDAYTEYDPDVFRGKTVLLPCDDPEWSNFTKFFALNFDTFGLRRLISTSYAPSSSDGETRGKIFMMEGDTNHDGITNMDDLQWRYLEGDGDFRSDEIKAIRDESDIIITNPPFSLFREFLPWIMESGKQFAIIGNMNAITYKEVYPLIKDNKIWLGATGYGSDMVFAVPEGYEVKKEDRDKAARMGYVGNYTRLGNSCWFSNLEHGKRHSPLPLLTARQILKYTRHSELHGRQEFSVYKNYDAIDVPYLDSIPSDYDGVMGVPITFLDKYCPEQFEIVGFRKGDDGRDLCVDGKWPYFRILIRKKH